jgi:mRNA interferase YafQ
MKKYGIVYTKQFRRDIKSLKRSGFDRNKLEKIIDILAEGKEIPAHYRNHQLKGAWSNAEECHIAPDWLLIYERHEAELVLVMIRTGTHSKLFNL